MERIVIKNFGGITELDIELGEINVFIGKQASGKSVTVKLVYFFKTVFASFFRIAQQNLRMEDWFIELLNIFGKYFPKYAWENLPFEIRFYWDEEYIEITNIDTLRIGVSERFLGYFVRTQELTRKAKMNEYPKLPNDSNIPEVNIYQHFVRELQQELGEYAGRSTLFVPAGRSFLAQLEKSIFTLLDMNNPIEIFIQQFGRYYEGIKDTVLEQRNDDVWYLHFVERCSRIIGAAEYYREKGQDYLRYRDNRIVEIAHAASGQQELLPLLTVLRSVQRVQGNGGGMAFIIEEPEAHIFPSTQRELIELMSILFNKSRQPIQYLITTHSPYILTAFNNLLQAGILAEDERVSKEVLYAIVPEEQALKRGSVAAFEMSNGTAKSIIDTETGLIDAAYLDSVSTETAQQFDNLLDLMP